MGDKDLAKITDIFLEEQQWVPGYHAPFFVWLGLTAAAGVLMLGTVWIIQHNKEV